MSDHSADSEPTCAGPDGSQQEHDAGGDDWSHTADRKAKKRMQNRVAQRSYRQRMKARVEELQAKVEQLEGTKQGQSIPASSNANASPTMITAGMNAPDKFSSMSSNGALFATRRDSQLGSAYQPGAPTANMMPSTSPNATRNHSIAMMRPNSVDSRSQASHHMANFDLLNSSAVPSSMAQEMSTNMALNNLHLQSTPFGDHNPCFDYFGDIRGNHTRQPNFMDAVTYQDNRAMTSTTMGTSREESPSDFLAPSLSDLNSPNESYRSSSMASAELPPQHPAAHISNGASVEERVKYVSEQAKIAGFPDLDAMITAYYTVLAGDPSGALGGGEGAAARRLPRLIATLRHAVQEWRDWEGKGFPLD